MKRTEKDCNKLKFPCSKEKIDIHLRSKKATLFIHMHFESSPSTGNLRTHKVTSSQFA